MAIIGTHIILPLENISLFLHMAKKKRQGHYCKVCGERKANEKFSGKGHATHICKKCQSLSKDVQADMMRNNEIVIPSSLKDWILLEKEQNTHSEGTFDYDYADLEIMPVFPEKINFKKLDDEYKALLREYIRREVAEFMEFNKRVPKEHELIEIRKEMIRLFEEEYNLTLKSDPILRQFFGDNAAVVINRLQKKIEDNG
jgi:Formamidopyrimidine-DNA glycosylase